MKVFLTGSAGQLGQALLASRPQMLGGEPLELIATSRVGGAGLLALDLADPQACRHSVARWEPDWVINAGAYTAVDRAEQEPAAAMAVNAEAPRAFAEALADLGRGRLLQLSTDFVFNGQQGCPYQPDQPRSPLGVYGASKAAGEEALESLMGHGCGYILRTSWVYGPTGHNFLLTMLRLHRERAASCLPLRVVADQVGCPTSTAGLAVACWRIVAEGSSSAAPLPPVMHWSDAGAASWYDFAMAIGELATAQGLLERPARVEPIRSVAFPTPAQRPSYSLLACEATRDRLRLEGVHWREALAAVIGKLAAVEQR